MTQPKNPEIIFIPTQRCENLEVEANFQTKKESGEKKFYGVLEYCHQAVVLL